MPSVTQEPRALLLNGTVGSGKTTTADAIGDLLAARGLSYAVIDLDWLRFAGPAPDDDPFNEDIGRRNLTSLVANYRDIGTNRFVLAGVIETTIGRRKYEEALGMPLTVVRLQVDLERVRQRLLGRHPPGGVLDWHLRRSGELHTILTDAAVDNAVVEVSADDPVTVAARVVDATGWLS